MLLWFCGLRPTLHFIVACSRKKHPALFLVLLLGFLGKARKKEKKCISAQGIRAQRGCVFLPDEFGEVSEAEEKDTNINYCHKEYAYSRADSLQG